MKKQKKWGFTLIEMLVVVLIIGILAAVALPQYQKAVVKTQFVQMVVTFNSLVQAQHVYYLEHGEYATQLSQLDMTTPLTNNVYNCNPWLPGAFRCYFKLGRTGDAALILTHIVSPNVQKTCCAYPKKGPWGDVLCSGLANSTSWYNGCGDPPCHCYLIR